MGYLQHTIIGNGIIFTLLLLMEVWDPSQLRVWPCPGKQNEVSGLGFLLVLTPPTHTPTKRESEERGSSESGGKSCPYYTRGWAAVPAPLTHSSSRVIPGLSCASSPGVCCPNSREEDVRRGKCPTMSPSTDTSLLSATLSLFSEGRPLSLSRCPPAKKSRSCCLWRLKGLESQYGPQSFPGPGFSHDREENGAFKCGSPF